MKYIHNITVVLTFAERKANERVSCHVGQSLPVLQQGMLRGLQEAPLHCDFLRVLPGGEDPARDGPVLRRQETLLQRGYPPHRLTSLPFSSRKDISVWLTLFCFFLFFFFRVQAPIQAGLHQALGPEVRLVQPL